MKLHLITLKLSKELSSRRSVFDLFNDRDSCDVFIKSLIESIEDHNLRLYGFVILSDQVHLILQPVNNLNDEISTLSRISAKLIIMYLTNKLLSLERSNHEDRKELRSFIDHFLNTHQNSIWQKKVMTDELVFDSQMQLDMISADLLREYLVDNERNYLHLGANAFTRLMMDRMKI